eukprot:1886227-Pyramimonas_sp.AAC.1
MDTPEKSCQRMVHVLDRAHIVGTSRARRWFGQSRPPLFRILKIIPFFFGFSRSGLSLYRRNIER